MKTRFAYIKTCSKTFLWKFLLIWGRVLLQATRGFLKETIFFSVDLIFGGCAEAYSEPYQISKMECVEKTVNSFLYLQRGSSYIIYRALNTVLRQRTAFWNLLEWSHWFVEFVRAKHFINHKYFQINQYFKYLSYIYLKLQEVKIVGIRDRERPLYALYISWITWSLAVFITLTDLLERGKKESRKYISLKNRQILDSLIPWKILPALMLVGSNFPH